MTPVVRPADSDDVRTLVGLMGENYAEAGYPFDRTVAEDALRRLIVEPALGRIWILELDEECAGYSVVTRGFSLEYGGVDAFLDDLFVAAEFRRRGLGRTAVQRAIRYCRDSGVRALHLEVETHNTGAADLYRALGFTNSGRQLLSLGIADPGG